MPIEIKIDSSTIEGVKEWVRKRPAEMKKQLNRAVQFSIADVERGTKKNAPVRTGTLRTSIHRTQRNLEGEVAAGVHYAIHQEYGTKYFGGRYFMTKAVRSLTAKINWYFVEALKRVAS